MVIPNSVLTPPVKPPTQPFFTSILTHHHFTHHHTNPNYSSAASIALSIASPFDVVNNRHRFDDIPQFLSSPVNFNFISAPINRFCPASTENIHIKSRHTNPRSKRKEKKQTAPIAAVYRKSIVMQSPVENDMSPCDSPDQQRQLICIDQHGNKDDSSRQQPSFDQLPGPPRSPLTEVRYLNSLPSALRPSNDAWVPVVNDRADGSPCLYRTTQFIHKASSGGVFQGIRFAAPEMIHFSVIDLHTDSPLAPFQILTSPWSTTHFLTASPHVDQFRSDLAQHEQTPGTRVNLSQNAFVGLYIAPTPDLQPLNHRYKIQLVCRLPDVDSICIQSITIGTNPNIHTIQTPHSNCIIESSPDCSTWTTQHIFHQSVPTSPTPLMLNEPVRDAKYWRFTQTDCTALSFGMLSFNQDVAIKKVPRTASHEAYRHGDNPNREALVQRLVQSIFTARLIDVHDDERFDPNYHWIVSHFYHNKDLYDKLNQNSAVSELTLLAPDVVGIMWAQLVLAVYFLHHHLNIVHLDLKPSNIFVDDFGNLILADFGVARRIFNNKTQYNVYTNGDRFHEELLFRSQPLIPQFITDPALSYAQGGLAMLKFAPHLKTVDPVHPLTGIFGTKDYMCPDLIKQHALHRIALEERKVVAQKCTANHNECPHPTFDGIHCRYHHAQHYGFDPRKSDVFSLGVILFTTLFKTPPFVGYARNGNSHWEFLCQNGTTMLARSFAAEHKVLYQNFDDDVFSLLDQLLAPTPNARPLLTEIIHHPYTVKYLQYYLHMQLTCPAPLPKIVSTIIPPQFYHRPNIFPIGQKQLYQTLVTDPGNVDLLDFLRKLYHSRHITHRDVLPSSGQPNNSFQLHAHHAGDCIIWLDDLYPVSWTTLGDSHYATIAQTPLIHYHQFNTTTPNTTEVDLTIPHNVSRVNATFRRHFQLHNRKFLQRTRTGSPTCDIVVGANELPSYNGAPIFPLPPSSSTHPTLLTRYLWASHGHMLRSAIPHPAFRKKWEWTSSPWCQYRSANYPHHLFRFVYPSVCASLAVLLSSAGSATRPSVASTFRPSFHIAPLNQNQRILINQVPSLSQPPNFSTSLQDRNELIRYQILMKISDSSLINNFNWGRYHRLVCLDFVDILSAAGRFHFGFKSVQIDQVEAPIMAIRGTLNITHHSTTFENPTYWSVVNEQIASHRIFDPQIDPQQLAMKHHQYNQVAMTSNTGHVCSGGLANVLPCPCCQLSFFSDLNNVSASSSQSKSAALSLIVGNPREHIDYHSKLLKPSKIQQSLESQPITALRRYSSTFNLPIMGNTDDNIALPLTLPTPRLLSTKPPSKWNQHYLKNTPFPTKLTCIENDPLDRYLKPNLSNSTILSEQSLRYLHSSPFSTVLISPHFHESLGLQFDRNLMQREVIARFHPTFAALMAFKPHSFIIPPNISNLLTTLNPQLARKQIQVTPGSFPSLCLSPTAGNPTVTVQQTIGRAIDRSTSEDPHSIHTPRFLNPSEIPRKYPSLFAPTVFQSSHHQQPHQQFQQQFHQHPHQQFQQHPHQTQHRHHHHHHHEFPPQQTSTQNEDFLCATQSYLSTLRPSIEGPGFCSSTVADDISPLSSTNTTPPNCYNTGMNDNDLPTPSSSTPNLTPEHSCELSPLPHDSPSQLATTKFAPLHRLPALPVTSSTHQSDSLPSPAIAILSQRHSFHRAVAHIPELINSGIYKHHRRQDCSEVLEYGIPIEILISQSYPEVPPVIALLPINGFAINYHHPLIMPYTTQTDEQVGIIAHPLLSRLAQDWIDSGPNANSGLLYKILRDLQVYFSHDLPPYIPYDHPLLSTMMDLAHVSDPLRYITQTPTPPVHSSSQQATFSPCSQLRSQAQELPPSIHPRWAAVCQWVNHIMIQQLPYHYDLYPPQYDEYFTNHTRPRAILSTPINTTPYPSSFQQ